MSTEKIKEAVRQMKVTCQLKMAEYEMVSARGILFELGYSEGETNQVLQAIYDAGFTYCLDPLYHSGSELGIGAGVCYFGPDQMESRLDSCYFRIS